MHLQDITDIALEDNDCSSYDDERLIIDVDGIDLEGTF